MEVFWDGVPQLVGRTIREVRYTALATTLGESFVVVVCTDGTIVRLRCGELGCEVVETLQGDGTGDG